MKQAMRKTRLIVNYGLVVLSFSFAQMAAQKKETYRPTYPRNAGQVIALAEILSRVDYPQRCH